jgi:TfdA family taurine catabolism dioxygenase TauD
MTTTGHTQSFGLPLHGEMYYLKRPPQLLWFYCATPSKSAGETTICDGAALYARLPQTAKDFFAQHRIKYVRELVDGDWQATFMTDDFDEVARFCADNDLNFSIDREARIVRTEFVCDAVRHDGGVPVFINNIALIYTAEQAFESGWAAKNFPGLRSPTCPIVVRTEDGARLPKEVIGDIQRAAETIVGDIRWQRGDIAMIDNRRILHGRRQTDGGKRAVLVRIGDIGFAHA